jgi:hypothetical protein
MRREAVQRLQQSHGNAYVQRLLQNGGPAAVQREAEAEHPARSYGEEVAEASGSDGGNAAGVHTYKIELKAWIPHAHVVDPEDIPGGEKTYFRGDNHAGYDGGYRVLSVTAFDWDGSKISRFRGAGFYGDTHRDHYDGGTFKGADVDTATSATTQKVAGADAVEMGIESANPLVRVWAPDIDSSLKATMVGNGMVLNYSTDGFPSHGIRVFRDGQVVMTKIVHDASGIPALGNAGALNVLNGLTTTTAVGVILVPPPDTGVGPIQVPV